ncbi:hypothetical protein [Bifidobacterium porcinum]|uniref:hypothetical protein n=1 Tax=Bifidobacterium porcinum TaxID=212365 RepID=UPI0005298D05|nr:hypothetical protein [Bifidobacterium porcinum]
MGVARGRCWAAGVVTGVLAVAPSAWLRNVKVSDVGAHTADVSFDWDLSYLLNGKRSGSYKDLGYDIGWKVDYVSGGEDYHQAYGAAVDPAKDIDGVCFAIGVGRATSVTPAGDHDPDTIYYDSLDCGDSDPTSPYTGVANDKMTPEDYQRITGTRTCELYQGGKVTGPSFNQYSTRSLAEAGAKPGTLKGHVDMALTGLDASTLYGNTKDTADMDTFYGSIFLGGNNSLNDAAGRASFNLYKKGMRTATKVDIRSLRLGVAVHLKDSSKAVQTSTRRTRTPATSSSPNVYGDEMSSPGRVCLLLFLIFVLVWSLLWRLRRRSFPRRRRAGFPWMPIWCGRAVWRVSM